MHNHHTDPDHVDLPQEWTVREDELLSDLDALGLDAEAELVRNTRTPAERAAAEQRRAA